ncbi:hypothetical protein PHLCEN_2v4280 [Hermanssonia centrifuga]|uniref:Uncharacterized protein n=1 Tax=Hermanssonia centrifuga TaxID=98765 RepID=A0A2R6PWD4_9APHY|nr:hypothetical protein PHLCEN_2v4280 [Hermanssonia centrifuga]
MQGTDEHGITSGGVMQMGGSPPSIPSALPTIRRNNQYRYDPDVFQGSTETSQRYPPPMGGSFALRRDVGAGRFRAHPDHYNAEDATSTVLAQLEEGRNSFHQLPTSRSEPYPFDAHEHQPHSYYSTSRRSSASSTGHDVEDGLYSSHFNRDRHPLLQRAYIPDIPPMGGTLSYRHHSESRASSSLSHRSAPSNTSQHSQALGIPQPGASHTAATYLHPSQSQQLQSFPNTTGLRVGTPILGRNDNVAANLAYASVPSFEHPIPALESCGLASLADDPLNDKPLHPGADLHAQSDTLSSTASHGDASGEADTSRPLAGVNRASIVPTSTRTDSGSSAEIRFNDKIQLAIRNESLPAEISLAVEPEPQEAGGTEPAYAERDVTPNVEEQGGKSIALRAGINVNATVDEEREDEIKDEIEDEVENEVENEVEDEIDDDDEPIAWKRRVTDENRRELIVELAAVDALFSDIAKKSGYSVEQVSSVYQAKNGNISMAPNYWNLYSIWFADHTLEECRRINPDTPDELINTTGISANDRSRCFSLFKKEYRDNYREILSAYHDVYVLSSAPQTLAKRVRTFRKLCDHFEMMAQSAHKQYGFEVAFVATGSSAHQDDKVGKVFESSGLSGVRIQKPLG